MFSSYGGHRDDDRFYVVCRDAWVGVGVFEGSKTAQ